MQRHAVHRRRHAVLADAVVDIAAPIVRRGEGLHVLRLGVVRAGEVRRTADGFGHRPINHVQRVLRGIAGGDPRRALGQVLLVGGDGGRKGRQGAFDGAVEVRFPGGGGQALRPGGPLGDATGSGGAPGLKQGRGDFKRREIPIQVLAGGGHFLVAQSRAMGGRGALLVGGAEADDGLAGDQHRLAGHLGGGKCRGDLGGVVAVDARHGPAGGGEAGQLVGRVGQRNLAVDRDAVVVPQDDQIVELQVAGQRDGLLGNAFHQAAVAGQRIGLVAHQIIAEAGIQVALGHGEAHGVGEALPQGAGGRLDAGGVAIFGVARGLRPQLPEVPDLVQRHVIVAEEIKQRIQQHRPMAGRQDEAVAVRPVGIGGIELEKLREQHGCHIGHAHGHSRVSGVRLLHRIEAEEPDGVRQAAGLVGGHGGHCWRFLWELLPAAHLITPGASESTRYAANAKPGLCAAARWGNCHPVEYLQ